MLLLQNWSQVLINLSQATSIVPPVSVRVPTKRRDQIPPVDVFCSDSFQNSLKYFQSSECINVFSKLPKHFYNDRVKGSIFSQCSLTTSKVSDIDTDGLQIKERIKSCTWLKKNKGNKEIYFGNILLLEHPSFAGGVSSYQNDRFIQEKADKKKKFVYTEYNGTRIFKVSAPFLTSVNLSSFSKRMHYSFLTTTHQESMHSMQRRGFKTERNLKAELERNPGIVSRIFNFFSTHNRPFTFLKSSLNLTRNENPLGKSFKQDTAAKKIISDELMSSEVKQVAMAFADGYMKGKEKPAANSWKTSKLISLALAVAFCYYVIASWLGGSKMIFNLRLRNIGEVNPEEIDVTFDDVKGAEEAKQELQEVVEFLKNPEKFSALGGKLPKGVLLVGPPGTGKTLLARAVAGEAGVPFFHAAGPEFDEILVGQGARRVRDLFRSAKDKAPCVIFIDEIDSVGYVRSSSPIHPYANQTINQLLAEMDGFHKNEGVIVIGATNRKTSLDKALLRPGRFDVEIHVRPPDLNGRKDIFDLYLGKILCKNLDVSMLAKNTIGFTGADIENMVNQAALKAAIDGADFVTMEYLDYAREKIMMGPELKSLIPDEETNLITAYHESGHAIVAHYTEDSPALYKVTIVRRNESFGHTAFVPDKEIGHSTRSQLLGQLDSALGGRAAEELIFGPNKVTTGCSSDLERATFIATRMVKDYGMSEKIGLRLHVPTYSNQVVINEWGQTTSDLIDAEIKRIIQESYERAKNILKKHAKEHKLLAEALLKYETLNAEEVKAILNDRNSKEKNATNIN